MNLDEALWMLLVLAEKKAIKLMDLDCNRKHVYTRDDIDGILIVIKIIII